jgi:UDP-GlcNAc3NAcA epimerase
VFFRELGIPAPRHHLGIGGLGHGAMTGRLMERIEELLVRDRPAVVLVYGDTDSTLAGALAAAKLNIPVAHVEAGLRSFDKTMPEEINRILTDHVSDLLLAPSQAAIDNLAREGLPAQRCVKVGDVMYDACLAFSTPPVRVPSAEDSPYVVCTVHRASNTDVPALLQTSVDLLCDLAHHVRVVFPVHPRTRKCLEQAGLLDRVAAHCDLRDPVGYVEMLQLVRGSVAVLTDSGGLQKEAHYLGRRALVIRDTTEWMELVAHGHAVLHPLTHGVLSTSQRDWLLAGPIEGQGRLYGGGRAADAVAQAIAQRCFPQAPT